MKSGRDFPCILQVIWEAEPDKGPIQVSKLDLTEAYQNGTLRPSQMESLVYLIPSAAKDNCIII